MQKVDKLFEKVVERIKKYNKKAEISLLEQAYEFSKYAHKDQKRASGEPYIVHPLEVSYILADLELDTFTVIAGMLHDVIEDTDYSYDEIKERFNKEIADLVEGVTKLGRIPYTSKKEQEVENLRKMFLAMAQDIRVVLIKLADRLHNMRTLKYMSNKHRLEKGQEAIEIYAPLAHRLGIYKIKWELEDLGLRNIDPDGYYDLVEKISIKRQEREQFINQIINELNSKIKELDIECSVEGRPKHFYSIYKKMKEQNKTIEEIYDLFALRILVNSVKDCYAILGLVHELYMPLPGRFKDYIAMPKPNMYQSLHTTLMSPEGQPFEVQIRTWEMHRIAETGIAAHWKYKDGNQEDGNFDEKLVWLRQLLEWQKEMRDEDQFLENLKIDLFTDEVFVFTPRGDVISLPAGSTPIDFAYNIHSEVGNKMMGAKINGKIAPIDSKLENGDIVEALTSSNVQGPSRDWLKIVKSSQAKNKINQWFKREKREENIVRGKELIEKELKRVGFQYNQLFKSEWIEKVLRRYSMKNLDDLFAAIGYGAILAQKIVTRLKEEYKREQKETEKEDVSQDVVQDKPQKRKNTQVSGVVVKGIDNCLVKFAKCCNPVPGDEIVGYITRGRGVSIHRKDCINFGSMNEQNRIIEVQWQNETNTSYPAEIQIMANDRELLLIDITNTIAEFKLPITAVNAKATKDNIAIIDITLEIFNTDQLSKIIKKIKKIDSVVEVTRGGRS